MLTLLTFDDRCQQWRGPDGRFVSAEVALLVSSDDELVLDDQDWFPQGTVLYSPEDDLGQAIDLFAMDQLNIPIGEGNILDPIDVDDPIIGTNPLVIRYGITNVKTIPVNDTTPVVTIPVNDTTKKEDSTMSQSKTDPNHRTVITQDENGTQVHVNPNELSSETQDRLTMREVRKRLHELKQEAEGSDDAFTLARFAEAKSQVQYWEERSFRTVAVSQWNKKISPDSRYIQRRIRGIKAIQQRQEREASRVADAHDLLLDTYTVTWGELVKAIQNPDADPKLKELMKRGSVKSGVAVSRKQRELIQTLAA